MEQSWGAGGGGGSTASHSEERQNIRESTTTEQQSETQHLPSRLDVLLQQAAYGSRPLLRHPRADGVDESEHWDLGVCQKLLKPTPLHCQNSVKLHTPIWDD